VEALSSEEKRKTDGITPSLLDKGDARLTDVIMGCVEILQSLGNPSHEMWGQRYVLPLNV
jgi:hypothetical protein